MHDTIIGVLAAARVYLQLMRKPDLLEALKCAVNRNPDIITMIPGYWELHYAVFKHRVRNIRRVESASLPAWQLLPSTTRRRMLRAIDAAIFREKVYRDTGLERPAYWQHRRYYYSSRSWLPPAPQLRTTFFDQFLGTMHEDSPIVQSQEPLTITLPRDGVLPNGTVVTWSSAWS